MSVFKQLKKRWRQRLSAFFIISSLMVLMDELVKEGYVFDPKDLFNHEVTHEKLFLIFLILGLLFGIRKK